MLTTTADALVVTALVFAVTLLFAACPWGRPVSSTLDGALAALEKIHDWSKWMAAIQTATMAGLVTFLFGERARCIGDISGAATVIAIVAIWHLGAPLAVSGWILSSTPSLLLRLHEQAAHLGLQQIGRHPEQAALPGPLLAPGFDVYRQPLYAWAGRPQLGTLLTLQHALWFVGLATTALLMAKILIAGALR